MLAFIDESGHPHPKDPVSRPVLAAVCVSESRIRDLARQIHNLKRDSLGRDEAEIKSHNMLKRSTLERRPECREFIEQLVALIANFDLHIFAMIMTRPAHPIDLGPDSLPNHYRFLLERIHLCTESRSPDDMALLVFDGIDERRDLSVAQAITGYLYRHSEGRSYARLVESPLFVNSKVTPGIQLTDLVAGIIRIYHENNLNNRRQTDPFLAAIARYYPALAARTIDLDNARGGTCFGFYQMGAHLVK